jgi:hypothetical protein
MAELRQAVKAWGHRVFFGAFHRSGLKLTDRLVSMLLASQSLLPEGDSRHWTDVEAWADGIAQALAGAR